MTHSPRHAPRFARGAVSFAAIVAGLLIVAPAASVPAAAEDARIIIAANVRLRGAPSTTAPLVAEIPLGTEVREASPSGLDKTWVLVRLDDAREGWVQGRLARPFDPRWPWPTFDAIIKDRLSRTGDGFPAAVQLVAFIDRVRPTYNDADSRARIELARLEAVARAAAAIPFRGATREPYASWLTAHGGDVVYDEPGGRWLLSLPAIWKIHAAHAASPSAEDIAWLAVSTGLPGECEGHVACYLSAASMLQGAFLRAHPSGSRAADAVAAIDRLLEGVAPAGKIGRPYQFDRAVDCRELGTAVDGLAAAIDDANAARWEAVLVKLDGLRALCR
jgi:hypothetical protein